MVIWNSLFLKSGTRYGIPKITTNVDPVFGSLSILCFAITTLSLSSSDISSRSGPICLEDIDELIEQKNLQR